jgi:cytochrome c-type biogenesis protein CcmF
MFGRITIIILLLMSLVSSILYFYSNNKKNESLLLARKIFMGLIIGTILISAFFIVNIFNHNFQYTYIYEYSSSLLNPFLLFSSYFAGQQGSLLMWVTLFSIMGFFLIPFAKKYNYESQVMGLYAFLMSFIFLMLVFKSPFEYIWESINYTGFSPTEFPKEGRGLNPVLENLWIIIHPPILFTGYTAVAIPFIFALAGLIKKDYNNWIDLSRPWILFASFTLGLGIILGGFWAYETLGWGGFWGWDPVENSSLLPWLGITALLHTVLVQKKTGGLIKTNMFLAILSFILVLYATFLTRSGVLGNMSVHSFADPGAAVYNLLIGMLIIFSLIGFYAFLMRQNDIKSSKLNFIFTSREFLISLGSISIVLFLIIVFLGTSWPLISEMFGNKTSVDPTFYDNWSMPLLSLVLLTNVLSLYLPWREAAKKNTYKRIIISFLVSVIISIILIFFKMKNPYFYILAFLSIFSLVGNFEFGMFKVKTSLKKIGGNISHIGLSFVTIGIILLSNLSVTKILQLKQNEPVNDFGYKITLIDKLEIEKNKPDRQKFIYRIKLENASENFIADPVVYWSDFNQRKAPIIEPFISKHLFNDLYVVLKSSQAKGNIKSFAIQKGKSSFINNDSSIKITFTAFDMEHSKAINNESKIGTFVTFTYKDYEIKDTLKTKLVEGSVNSDILWKKLPETEYDIALLKIIPNKQDMTKSEAVYMMKRSDQTYETQAGEELSVEFSTKPGINLVWVGFFMIIFGSLIANIFHKIKIKE